MKPTNLSMNLTRRTDRRLLLCLLTTAALCPAQPVVSSVLNGASFNGNLAPGGTGGPVLFSLTFVGATFDAAFDIVPNSRTFSVLAATEAGTAVINIDPVHNTWQREFDFANVTFPIRDFLACPLRRLYSDHPLRPQSAINGIPSLRGRGAGGDKECDFYRAVSQARASQRRPSSRNFEQLSGAVALEQM